MFPLNLMFVDANCDNNALHVMSKMPKHGCGTKLNVALKILCTHAFMVHPRLFQILDPCMSSLTQVCFVATMNVPGHICEDGAIGW